MSPRIIKMPLSGGDRKHFARELRRVEQRYASLLQKIPDAHRAADQYRALAYRLECEAWNMRLYLGEDHDPSPRIADALAAGITLMRVKCGHCRKEREVDLAELVWPREKQIHTVRPKLFCLPCKTDTGRSVRPMLMGLCITDPDGPQSAAGAW